MVVGALREAGTLPYSFAPSSGLVSAAGEPVELFLEPLRRALDLGLLPVVYGDVVMDREQGCAICSTESLFLALVAALQERGRAVDRIFWLGETDGVYDDAGEILAEIDLESGEEVLAQLEGAAGVDVTGGMRHRLETTLELARRGVSSWVGNGLEPGRLSEAVAGRVVPGTWIRA